VIGFVVRRFVQSAIVVWMVVTAVFVLLHAQPGSTAVVVLGPRAYPAQIAAFNRVNGLNAPLPVQYGRFLQSVLHGQITFAGPSGGSPYEIVNDYAAGVSLQQMVTGPLLNTLLLIGLALLVSIPAGLALGTWLAAGPEPAGHRRRWSPLAWLRAAVSLFSQAGYAIPVMVLGLFLTQQLAVNAGLVPFNIPSWLEGDVLSEPAGLVLPVLTLAIVNVALFSRYFRASMAEALTSDYALKARAVGASGWRVMTRHVARNAAIPVVTIAATRIPMIFSIEVPLEAYFQYPGIGNLAFQAATGKQFYTVLGAVLLVGVLVVASSFAADLVYLALDPRLHYRSA
jgi:peptide/nickel transport system permease protein